MEICHTLVHEDLNGTIQFVNTGKGTKVTISFPVLDGRRNMMKHKIMIVDDDPINPGWISVKC